MAHMGRLHKDLALVDADAFDLAVIDDLQDHVAFDLIEKFLHRVIVKIDPCVRPADNLRNHPVLFVKQLVADRRFKLVTEFFDPVVEFERACRHHGKHSPIVRLRLDQAERLGVGWP